MVSPLRRLRQRREPVEPRPKDFDVDILLRPRAAYALTILLLAKKPLTAAEFADALTYSTPSAASLRDYLLAHDLIALHTDPNDRLFIRISLTKKGERQAHRFLESRKDVHGEDWEKTRFS